MVGRGNPYLKYALLEAASTSAEDKKPVAEPEETAPSIDIAIGFIGNEMSKFKDISDAQGLVNYQIKLYTQLSHEAMRRIARVNKNIDNEDEVVDFVGWMSEHLLFNVGDETMRNEAAKTMSIINHKYGADPRISRYVNVTLRRDRDRNRDVAAALGYTDVYENWVARARNELTAPRDTAEERDKGVARSLDLMRTYMLFIVDNNAIFESLSARGRGFALYNQLAIRFTKIFKTLTNKQVIVEINPPLSKEKLMHSVGRAYEAYEDYLNTRQETLSGSGLVGGSLATKTYQLLANQYRKRACPNARPLQDGEIHPLCANWMGPGTNIAEALKYPSANAADDCARIHDIEYYRASKVKDPERRAHNIRVADEKIVRCLQKTHDFPYIQLGMAGINAKMNVEDAIPTITKMIMGKKTADSYFGKRQLKGGCYECAGTCGNAATKSNIDSAVLRFPMGSFKSPLGNRGVSLV